MISLKTKHAIAILVAVLMASLYISMHTLFIVLLVGLLVVPPALLMVSVTIEGGLIIAEKLKRFSESDNSKVIIN